MSLLTELIYLYTHPSDTLADVNRDRHRSLAVRLESIILAYDNLIAMLNDFAGSPEAARSLLSFGVADDLRCIVAARKQSYEAQEYARAMGSKKTEPREFYLHAMACIMEATTGKKQTDVLLDLINVGYEAQGTKNSTTLEDAKSLDRRIQRFRKKTNPPLPSSPNSQFSFHDFLVGIEVKD